MLTPHRLVSLVALLLLIAVFFVCEIPSACFFISLGVILILYLKIEFLGAYFIGLNFHLKSQNHLSRNTSKIALTFDDGPYNPQTVKVLDVLKKHRIKATFFVIGKNIKGNEAIVKCMQEEGHALGSHTFSHDYWIDVWGKKKLEADVLESIGAIKSVTGEDVKLLRPPYGVTTPNFAYVLKKLKLRSVGWDVRSYDTSTPHINKILQRVVSKTRNGSILLLHDRLDIMPELLEKLIPALKEKGFEFVTIAPDEI